VKGVMMQNTKSRNTPSGTRPSSGDGAGIAKGESPGTASALWSVIDSPVGPLFAAVRDGAVIELSFLGDDEPMPADGWLRDDAACDELRCQLEEYFAGTRTEFDLDLDPRGTDFQMEVWAALRDISYGTTASYGDIAAAIGRPKAVRAVGGANNANPISIIVPCHRVIGADGSLTGYGGGLGTKETLLALEQSRPEATD
jgi:methylated-DNA-[protein]-cysteine S-methyltransferase